LDEEDAAGFEVGGVDEPEAHALEEAEEVVGAREARSPQIRKVAGYGAWRGQWP
jgi:hypothetical protein